ncbi:MAG: T9SS type A sorting domain-containing protein, partial [candidate division WOR-3 bacterium]
YTTALGTGLDEQQRSCAELTLTAQPSITAAATKVRFNLNRPTLAKLIVYDLTGREVRTLLKEQLPAGEYVVDINRCGKKDCTLPHGVYLVRLQLGQASCSTKIVLK